jgi:sigma-B regulation protein RsbU (phosphoserine phosphatase)
MNMARSSHSRTSEKFVRDIRDAVSNFAGEAEQYDDITMLCFSNTTNHGESASAGLQQASIVVVNHQDEYKRLTTWLEEVGTNFGWNPGFLMKINLMLEEWFVNVISYAFSDNGVHEIEVKLSQNGSVVELCMIDDGQPFDPTQQPEADTESSVEERQVGGLGLHFLRGMLDEFSYRREGELNIVTMRKRMEDET